MLRVSFLFFGQAPKKAEAELDTVRDLSKQMLSSTKSVPQRILLPLGKGKVRPKAPMSFGYRADEVAGPILVCKTDLS